MRRTLSALITGAALTLLSCSPTEHFAHVALMGEHSRSDSTIVQAQPNKLNSQPPITAFGPEWNDYINAFKAVDYFAAHPYLDTVLSRTGSMFKAYAFLDERWPAAEYTEQQRDAYYTNTTRRMVHTDSLTGILSVDALRKQANVDPINRTLLMMGLMEKSGYHTLLYAAWPELIGMPELNILVQIDNKIRHFMEAYRLKLSTVQVEGKSYVNVDPSMRYFREALLLGNEHLGSTNRKYGTMETDSLKNTIVSVEHTSPGLPGIVVSRTGVYTCKTDDSGNVCYFRCEPRYTKK
jgi:hypothetical protein